MPELRVASINTHMAVPEGLVLSPTNERMEAIADIAAFVRDVDAHVVFLQEVRNDEPGARIGGVPRQFEQLREACEATGATFYPAICSEAGHEYGIAILVRGDRVRLEHAHAAHLPYAGGREPRVVLFAQAWIGDVPVTVANLHLDHTGVDRRGQLAEAERILEALLAHRPVRVATRSHDYRRLPAYRGPLVVGGDFNDAEHVVAESLARTRLINVVDGLDPDDPLRRETHVQAGRIDHLLLSPELALLDQQLHCVPRRAVTEGTGVTDHLAIVACLGVPAAATGDDADEARELAARSA